MAEHDQGGDGNGVGDAEERAHVDFAAHGHRRHHAAQAFGASGQEQAPHEGVDGGAAGQGVRGEVAINRGQRGQVAKTSSSTGAVSSISAKPGVVAPPSAKPRRVRQRRPPPPRGRSPAPRAPGRPTDGEVLVPAAQVDVAQSAARVTGSLTTMTRQPWRLPPLGAKRAVSRSRSARRLPPDRGGTADGTGAAQRVDEVEAR